MDPETAKNARIQRLERVKSALCYPGCGGDLSYGEVQAACGGCGAAYAIQEGRIYFAEAPARDDALDGLKGRLKALLGGLYYSVGVTLIAPTFPFNYARAISRRIDPAQGLVIDIGCGNNRVSDDLVTADLYDYDAVDIVCDLTRLPFKNNSIDAFVSRSVLEHVRDLPQLAVGLGACTKPGGLGMHLIPFLYPYHASPHDYTRLTHSGAAALFKDWELLEQRNATGPVTYFLTGLIEFLSTVFSLGNESARAIFSLIFSVLLFPIKFLDAPFIGRRSFFRMAPTILTVVRKPDGQGS